MLSAASWLVLILAHNVASRTIQFYIEPTQKVVPTYVQQLVEGKMDKIDQKLLQGVRQTASVSLVYDSGYYIIVDTPSATDVSSKEHMLRELETPPPEIRDLVKSVKQAVPYVLQNVVEPAALELKKSAHKIPKINESEIAPAVENAAIHFSRLIQNQAYMENPNLQKRTEPSTEYPYMTYWQNMLKKIANEVPQIQEVISSITTPNKTVRGTFHRQPSLNTSTAKPNQISSLIQRLFNPPYQSLNNGAPN